MIVHDYRSIGIDHSPVNGIVKELTHVRYVSDTISYNICTACFIIIVQLGPTDININQLQQLNETIW